MNRKRLVGVVIAGIAVAVGTAAAQSGLIRGLTSGGEIKSVLVGSDGAVNITGTISSGIESSVSTDNSTSTPLGAGGVYTGTYEDVTNFSSLTAVIETDQATATNGACVQFSDDASNLVREACQTLAAGSWFFSLPSDAKYVRIKYTNGATPQGTFVLQTIKRTVAPTEPIVPLGAAITDLNVATISRGHLFGRRSTGAWDPVGINSSGEISVAAQSAATAQTESTGMTSDTTILAALASRRLMTLQCWEDAGAVAEAEIRHGVESGGSCTGAIIQHVRFTANEAQGPLYLGDRGVAVASGICADVTSGSISCALSTVTE